jgi:hypothetical protein
MSGTFQLTISEARGYVAIPADLDRLAVVLGCSSAGSGQSAFYLSAASAVAGVGYGDAVDTLCQIIEQRQSSGQTGVKVPAALYTTPATTPGSYGVIDVTGVTGTATAAVDATSLPRGTYEAWLKVTTGFTVGTTGGALQWSLDGGRNYSRTIGVGTATSYTIPNSNVKFDFGPTSTNAAYVTLAVELRADTLAHLANAVAHDGADTSAAQVALAASSIPATVSASTAVVNLVRAALISHVVNITSVHDGPDLVAYTALAALSAATDAATGIDLANALKAIINTHEGVALVAAAAGLMGSTASIASPQTYTAASNFLAGGVAAMDAQPRRPEFVISGGGTPSDMADSVTITGFDYTDAAQTETGLSLTGLGTVKATKAFKGTGLSCAFVAADGTGATFTIGYSNGVHNSADVTNLITSPDASYGTFGTGDLIKVRTFAPAPDANDIDDAFVALAAGSADFSIIVLDFPLTVALAAHVTTGLNALADVGRDVLCLARYRLPDVEASESETTWGTALEAEFPIGTFDDSRIHLVTEYGLLTDATTTRQYFRSFLAQTAADFVRVERGAWADSPSDQKMANATLIDANGVTIGHDEGARGTFTGLSNDTLGNRFGCVERLSDSTRREDVYKTFPWVLYASDERIRSVPARRLVNALRRVIRAAGIPLLGQRLSYITTGPTTGTLTDAARESVHGAIFQAVSAEFGDEFDNAADAALDTGLIQVNPAVVLAAGGIVSLSITAAPKLPGYVKDLSFTIAVQE